MEKNEKLLFFGTTIKKGFKKSLKKNRHLIIKSII